jgi:TfoX/Sxy family transcriptional regulator of competence genes
MAYDTRLADRVRDALSRRKGFTEKKMFGGVGFLLRNNMCVGVWKEFLIVRLGPDAADEALRQPFVKEFDITGRAMTGWAMVLPEGTDDDETLRDWIARAIKFVSKLPAK